MTSKTTKAKSSNDDTSSVRIEKNVDVPAVGVTGRVSSYQY
jgi:hypothetical protein